MKHYFFILEKCGKTQPGILFDLVNVLVNSYYQQECMGLTTSNSNIDINFL